MGIFSRKVKVNVISGGDAAARMLPQGVYEMAWERQRMPDPGAQQFSWETLGLSPFNIVGSGFGPTRYYMNTPTPLYIGQAVPIVGIPRVATTIYAQPLQRGI